MTGPNTPRPSRFQLTNLVVGLVAGALLAGAAVPLVGADSTVPSSGTPSFLTAGDEPVGGAGEAAGAAEETTSLPPGGARAGGGTPVAAPGQAGPSTTASAGPGPAPSEPKRASDVGITADTIKIGAMVLDCGGCNAIGAPTAPASQVEAAYRGLVDAVNAEGGVAGRKLELVTARYDPVRDSLSGGGTERAACLELTEHQKVFAVLLGGVLDNSCIYNEHKTPLLTREDRGGDDDSFNRSGGRIWTLQAADPRLLYDFAHQIADQRIFPKDAKWGYVYVKEYEKVIQASFGAEMKKLGYTATRVSGLPTDQTQTPIASKQEVNAMRAAGITHVVMLLDFFNGGQWLRDAEQNGWRPQYVISEFTGADQYAGQQMAAAGNWDGTIGLSTTTNLAGDGFRQDPQGARCLERLGRIPNAPAPTSIDRNRSFDFLFCILLDVFTRAGDRAGVNPTRDSLAKALATTGQFGAPIFLDGAASFGGRTPFGPVKWSGADLVQRKVWQTPCPNRQEVPSCWVPAGPVVRMKA